MGPRPLDEANSKGVTAAVPSPIPFFHDKRLAVATADFHMVQRPTTATAAELSTE